MKSLKALIGGCVLACAAATSMNASAGIYDYTGTYNMDCDSVTRTVAVAFAYGEIEPTDGAILLQNADSKGAYFPVDFETCGDFTLDDLDADKIDEITAAAKARCLATEMPITGLIKEAGCTYAANQVKTSLDPEAFPDAQTHLASYVTNAIDLDVSCALVFFSWCLQYGTNSVYSFDDGTSNYYHAYINKAGKWLETFAADHAIQQPSLPCQGITQAVLNGDAEAAGTVATTMDVLDGYICTVPNPLDALEVISVAIGMDIRINQTGAE